MKTRSTRIAPVTNQIPRMAPATAMGIETQPLMKTRLTMLKLLIVLCCTFATTAVFGQSIITWTGGGDGTNFTQAANWGGTLPASGSSDIASFAGTPGGNLFLNLSNANFASGPGGSGISIQLTSSQIGNVALDNFSANLNPPNLAIWDIQIQSGAGAFSWGASNNKRINYAARPGGAVHSWVNESANPATIGKKIQWVAGGGTAYTMAFGGAGDWNVNNYLQSGNNGGGVSVVKNGSGTMTWNPNGAVFEPDGLLSVTINGGTLALLFPHSKIQARPITNNATFIFNAPSQVQTLSGVISGTGELRLNDGTLTLGGASTYTGNTVLNGGKLVVNSAENAGVSGPLGVSGTISFNGGALGWSVNNVFDYSSRFNTAASQQYQFDTGGRIVTLASGLASSGATLTKVGAGTLTLSGTSSYSGLTTVSAGRLAFGGSKTGTANITVNNSSVLGVNDTGTQVTPSTLTLGTSSLEYNNINSTTTAPLNPSTLSAPGTVNFSINSGTFTVGQSYPLLTWTSGSAPATTLGTVVGAVGNLSTVGNKVQFNATELALIWKGNTSGSWDSTLVQNWTLAGGSTNYADPKHVAFDDTATGTTGVTISGVVQPSSVTVFNNALNYIITNSSGNTISGSSGLVKGGNGTLTMSGGANNYTGVTRIIGGTLSVGTLANGGSASDIGSAGSGATNLVLDGGTLQYTGGAASIDRLFTLGVFGGTIDSSGSGALTLNNVGVAALSGTGARTLALAGTNTDDNTLAVTLGDNGGGTSLAKSGSGKWVVTGNNTNSGVTTIAGGVLQVGAGGASGALGTGGVVDDANLTFNLSSTPTVNGSISGTGSVTNNGTGTVILNGNNSYSGGTVINAGAVQFGNGGAGGTPFSSGDVVMTNNTTVIFNSTTPITIGAGGDVTGQGNVIVRAGTVTLGDGGTVGYTGWTLIDAGATLQPLTGQTTGFVSSGVTNNGTLRMISQLTPPTFGVTNNIVGTGKVFMDTRNQNAGQARLAGNNTYTGGTFLGGGGIVIGDGTTAGVGSIVGPVFFTNTTGPFVDTFNTSKRLMFNRPDAYTFAGDIVSVVSDGSSAANSGSVEIQTGTVTLTGNNSYPGDTTIAAGATLQVGNGGASGSIGTGFVTDNGTLVVNLASPTAGSIPTINGSGSFVQFGSGTTTLNGASNGITGAVTVSNGTLVVFGSVQGNLNVAGGTLVPVGVGAVGTTTVGGNMDISSGTISATLNTSLVQSNSLFLLTNFTAATAGTVTATGGTLQLNNVGPVLTVGQKFTLFSTPVTGGGTMTVTGAGATWQNDLATDGSVTTLTVTPPVNTTPTNIVSSISGGVLTLSWPADHIGWRLEVQTNTLAVGISTNWSEVAGANTTNLVNIPVSSAGTVFYRLIYP